MIEMKRVSMVYRSGVTRAIDDISLTINDGEFVFLVGPSGSGKTTIIKMLTGEIVPVEGSIVINGYELTKMRRRSQVSLFL